MLTEPTAAGRLTCPRPFEWCEIHPGGEVFLCCPAWLKKPAGNLLTQPLADIWNGPLAVEIRKTILNGSYHRCNTRRCPYLSGGRPFEASADAEVDTALADGLSTLPYGPKVLNLCFDRSCNLACPSCRPDVEFSSGSERRRAEAINDRILSELASNAVELRLSGFGDPFASPVYLRLLQAVGPQSFPALKRLHLHSNGMLWDGNAWRDLPNLHPYLHTAEISVDAAEAKTYAEIRRGCDFDRLQANLDFIASLPAQLTLSFVVQADNYRQMPAFVELARSFKAAVYFSQLVNWGTFSREEFARRAVHRPGHPRHEDLLMVLRQIVSQQDVDLGNLRSLLP